jgi:hypothetical protein
VKTFCRKYSAITTLNGGGWGRVNLRFALVNRTYLRNIVLSTVVPINDSMIVSLNKPDFA